MHVSEHDSLAREGDRLATRVQKRLVVVARPRLTTIYFSCIAWCVLMLIATQEVMSADERKQSPREAATVLIPSLSEISRQLAKETRDTSIDNLKGSLSFRTIHRTKNIPLWNELISQGDDPILQLTGMMCIEQEQPKRAFTAAVRCIMYSRQPASGLMGYPVSVLAKGATDRKENERIARMIENGPGSDNNIVVLLAALTRRDLIDSFDALDVDECPASRLAWVIDQLATGPLDDIGDKAKAKFDKCLESLAVVPGISRCVYLSSADEAAPNIGEYLRLALLDPDVDQRLLIPAIRRFGSKYRRDIEGWLKDAADERRAFVLKRLENVK